MRTINRLGLILLLGLAACEPVQVPGSTPGPSESPAAPSASSTPVVSGTPIPVSRVQVTIQVQNAETKTVIPGAQVTLSSAADTSPPQTADAGGRVVFADLRQDSQYTIDVQAQGYEGASRTADLSKLAALGQKELLLAIELKRVSATLSGRVLDAAGNPVAGATIFDTRQSATSDSSGRFSLGYATTGLIQLSIGKSGYQSASKSVVVDSGQNQDLGEIRLTARSGKLQLGIDATHGPLGQAALASYSGLQGVIGSQGYSLSTISSGFESSLDNLDVLLLISPSQSFSASEMAAIQAFVLSGRKLIVTGEWAGYGGFDAAAANQMLSPLGLQFGADTLREGGSGFLDVTRFETHPITSGLKELKFYQSGSVRLGEGGKGTLLARTAPESFQIVSNTGSFGVVLAGTYGSGKVILVGDSSCWSSEDSDGNGTPNLAEADNRKLFEQILAW